jgi:hypothetical protein
MMGVGFDGFGLKRISMRTLLLTLSIVWIPFAANATDVRIFGTATWYIPPTLAYVRLTADEITNVDVFYSDELWLEVWAFETPYNGSGQAGYLGGELYLGYLAPGFGFFDVDEIVPAAPAPPPGRYCPSIVLMEWQGSVLGYRPIDYVNTPCEWFGPMPNVPPVSSFSMTPSAGDAPLTVDVNGSSSHDSDGTVTSYAWTTSDGQAAMGSQQSFVLDEGNHVVSLTVTDDDGAQDTSSRTIAVPEPSMAAMGSAAMLTLLFLGSRRRVASVLAIGPVLCENSAYPSKRPSRIVQD